MDAAAEQKIRDTVKANEGLQEEQKRLRAKIAALEEENKKYSEDLNAVLHKPRGPAGEENLSIVAELKKKLRASERNFPPSLSLLSSLSLFLSLSFALSLSLSLSLSLAYVNLFN